jgi:hypothetical protein
VQASPRHRRGAGGRLCIRLAGHYKASRLKTTHLSPLKVVEADDCVVAGAPIVSPAILLTGTQIENLLTMTDTIKHRVTSLE